MGVFVKNSLKVKASGGPSLTSIYRWLDPSNTSTILENDAVNRCSQINDLSGNGRDLAQATPGNQPNTNITTQNGLNVLDFDNTAVHYVEGSNSPTLGDPTVQFFVARNDKLVGFSFLTGGLNDDRSFYWNDANASYQIFAGTANFIAAYTDLNVHILTVVINGASSLVYEDGVLLADNDTDPGGNVSNSFILGSWTSGQLNSSNSFKGICGEFLHYDTIISNSDLNQTGQYLSAKWGISWTDIV